MNSMIDFWSVNRYGDIIKETPLFTHFIDNEVPSRYDSNGMLITENATEAQLLELAALQLQVQTHVKFVFVPGVSVPLLPGFTLGELEVYELVAPLFTKNEAINVQFVTEINIEDFLQIKYDDALAFGETYAKERIAWLRRMLLAKQITAAIAYLEQQAVGALELIVRQNTVEIDQFFVQPDYQRQGIGSTMQAFIEEKFPFHTVFLVADADDTPREMYQKQGYEHRTTFYELLQQPPSL